MTWVCSRAMVRSSDVQSDQVGLSLSHIAVSLFEPPDFWQAAIAVRVTVVDLTMAWRVSTR
jgi:hypothetical protein